MSAATTCYVPPLQVLGLDPFKASSELGHYPINIFSTHCSKLVFLFKDCVFAFVSTSGYLLNTAKWPDPSLLNLQGFVCSQCNNLPIGITPDYCPRISGRPTSILLGLWETISIESKTMHAL